MNFPRVYILRTSRPSGAFGMMFDDAGSPFAVSLERTLGENEVPILSSGIYDCHRDRYHKGGYDTFEIEVAGHDRILFHKANKEEQLEGCVGVGEKFEDFGEKAGIAESGIGFSQFWEKYGKYEKIQLVIVDVSLPLGTSEGASA